ncbi:MAG: hypothetical protein C0413_05090 [Clostridiales bacterium]|nr:hypothetical protein [Clostridiales bacterium]
MMPSDGGITMTEDFGKKIEKFGQDIWKKTTGAVESISKSAEVVNKRRELKAVYADIGQLFTKKHPAQANDEFGDLTQNATSLEKEIADLEAQILEQRGSKKCVECGEQIPYAAAFCSKCGAPQPKQEPEPAEEAEVVDGWVCPACGQEMGSTDTFCSSCGVKRP